MAIIANVGIFDYDREKICDLYDSQADVQGSAYDIEFIKNYNGVHTLSFKLPYKYNGEINFRWQYLQSDYLIRLYYNGATEWFVASKPTKSKDSTGIIGTVMCNGLPVLLKTKNIYGEFDDENGIGKISELIPKVLAGSGWRMGHCDIIYEKDGQTEKVRSLKSSGKKGALELVNTVCNLFRCRPEYDTENMLVNIYAATNRNQMFEGEIGRNLNAICVKENSEDVVTRLYVEGEYGDDGYIGIDDVNPTGLNYLLNFDYYRKIGVFKARHETALQNYLTDIQRINTLIKANAQRINEQSDLVNSEVGQCDFVLYYGTKGWSAPAHIYGDPPVDEQSLNAGDSVIVLNTNGTFRRATVTIPVSSMIRSGEYGIAKFVTKAAGKIGSQEVQIEAKEKEIANLQRKIEATTKEDKIAEYEQEISDLESQIQGIYNTASTGLYARMHAVMKPTGMVEVLDNYLANHISLRLQQDEIEATFIVAMGNMLRDGYWQNNNYALGQEQALYDDAVEMSNQLAKPDIEYSIDYIRSAPVVSDITQPEPDLTQYNDIPIGEVQMNAIMRINDDDLDVHENLFVQRIVIGIDHEENGLVDVSNQDLTINSNDFGSLLSRMSQLADLIDQKNTLYERAKAFTRNGTLYTDRLNGQINVLTTQLLSTVSNWYTDDQGNIMFEAVDGGSAMMLCGAGFMIASSKNEDGSWNWRTFGTGEGFTADEIVAGFISAERIEAGSIATSKLMPDVGNTLIISGNPAITDLEKQLAPEFDPTVSYVKGQMVTYGGKFYVFKQDHPAGAWNEHHVVSSNLSTQIELLPDQIIQYIGEKGYSHTYYQETDPALDPDKEVAPGDYWVKKAGNAYLWNDVDDGKWYNYGAPDFSTTKDYNIGDIVFRAYDGKIYRFTSEHPAGSWNSTHVTYIDNGKDWSDLLLGVSEIYCRNGNGEWVQVFNTDIVAEAYTKINQTQFEITQEAYRANAAEGELRSVVRQTADMISQEVTRAGTAEGNLRSAITQTAESINTEVERAQAAESQLISKTNDYQTVSDLLEYSRDRADEAATSAKNASIAKTNVYQSADAIVNSAIALVSTDVSGLPTFSSSTQYYKGDTVQYGGKPYMFITNHKGAWSNSDVKTIVPYIAQTNTYQTADSIVSQAEKVSVQHLAPAFSTSTHYEVGDVVVYDGALYQFIHTHTGVWNISHVKEITSSEAYILKTTEYQTVEDLIDEAHEYAETAATTAKNASIAKTDRYQSADAIVDTAIAVTSGNIDSLPAFSTSKQYYVGDVVKYGGKGYEFTANHKGTWSNSHVKEIKPYIAQTTIYQTADQIVSTAQQNAAANIAPVFSASTSYAIGDIVSKDGSLYIFTQVHPAGAWNANHVKTTNANSVEISRIEQSANEIKQYVGNTTNRTFVGSDTPPSSQVKVGDYWVRKMIQRAYWYTFYAPAFSTSTSYAVNSYCSRPFAWQAGRPHVRRLVSSLYE